MESRIMQVFYDNDCLPYKDSARSVHYPIVGNSFVGASNTSQIRFYVRDIGGVNNVSWVAISKLPNGKIASQVLSTIVLDEELNEYYIVLDLSSYYTQLKGDLYISLNGYQGGIEYEQDPETGIYTIVGTPIIEATGSIKLAINYAPQMPQGQHFNISDLQQILGALSDKANVLNTIQVIDDVHNADLTGYEDNQLFFDLTTKMYYRCYEAEPYRVDGIGMLASDTALCRIKIGAGQQSFYTFWQLNQIFGTKLFLVNYNDYDYLVNFTFNHGSVRATRLNDLKSWYSQISENDGEFNLYYYAYFSDLLVSRYEDDIVRQFVIEEYYVPYNGASDSVDLGENSLRAQELYAHDIEADYIYIGGTDIDNLAATREYVDTSIVNAIESVKSNEFQLVDIVEYPTLEDFKTSTGEEGIIYLYPIDTSDLSKGYYQLIWENGDWLDIGTTQIDLSDYYTKFQVDVKVSNAVDTAGANVHKHQVETIFIVDPLTNINGRTFQNYTRTNVTIGGYTGVKILRSGNALDEDGAMAYMEYMCGSYYLPKYNYDYPKNTYFITPQGHIYKPQYDSTNGLVLYDFGDLATKDYADTKVAKSSEHNKVYGTDNSGNQKLFDVDNTVGADGNIVRRASGTSQIMVPLTPTANGHASSKKYVDDSIANSILAVVRFKGSKTVAEINALVDKVIGDCYNVSDDGTLTDGSVSVIAGDNVVWTGTVWDKLTGEYDLANYYDKDEIDAMMEEKADIEKLENGELVVSKATSAKSIEPVSSESGTYQDTPFISQGTGTANGTSSVDTSNVGKHVEKQGNTVAENQLVENGNFASDTGWSTGDYSTIAVSNNVLTATIVSTGTAHYGARAQHNVPTLTIGHKYLISCQVKPSRTNPMFLCFREGNSYRQVGSSVSMIANTWNTFTRLVNMEYACDKVAVCFNATTSADLQVNDTIQVKNFVLYDLTQWFNGDIPQDLLDNPDHWSLYQNYGDYIDYNTGSLGNSDGRFLVCTGRNQFDEQAEVGDINGETGQNGTGTNRIRSKNYIQVIPSLTYYFYCVSYDTGSNGFLLYQYDKDKNFISYTVVYGGQFNVSANTRYIRFAMGTGYGTTIKNDITISLYYSPEQGGDGYDQYYPYEQPKIYDTGVEILRKAGSVKDYKEPDGTIHRLVASVDLGSLEWTWQGAGEGFKTTLSQPKQSNAINVLISNGFTLSPNYSAYSSLATDKAIFKTSNNSDFYIKDNSWSSSTNISTVLNGVILNYELAEQTTEQGTPFSENIEINDYGTMYWLDTDGNIVDIPQGCKIFYPADYVLLVDTLNAYTNGDVENLALKSDLASDKSELQGVDTQLKNALGGTLRQLLAVSNSIDFLNTDFVDLGTLNWTYYNGTFRGVGISNIKSYSGSDTQNIICSKYKTDTGVNVYNKTTNNTICAKNGYFSGDDIIVYDTSAGTDATTFKNDMKGVLLAYEKAS